MSNPSITSFYVTPSLPEQLYMLEQLATNLRWSWDLDMRDCFLRLDRDLWDAVGHNPVRFLGKVDQSILEEAAADEAYLAHLCRVTERFNRYMENRERPAAWQSGDDHQIAYFCMEYGLNECLPIYSGGLGILAGDHLKSASDLGLPLVAVGLLYQQGYFHQYLNLDGWQQERYPINDFSNMPVKPALDEAGNELVVGVEFPQRTVFAKVWRVQVGRIPLYLLDTNITKNVPEDQNITDQLYGGDTERRLQQELILGIGGMRALDALG
ncbi:MAG: glycosyltransferase family 1 protein, partial [Gammaproteobacteria bacterium]|nr:glycosyltransferase family 1 protein [Gammaproteobacteria bacterium]